MREYQARTVQELAACTCDRCQRRLTRDEPGEWQERLSIDYLGGFDSVFGDGNTVSIDLCQHCVQEVLGPWLRITPLPAGADFPPMGPAPDVFGLWAGQSGDTGTSQDAVRSEWPAREVLQGSVPRYDDLIKPADVENEKPQKRP